jgi:peptidoglycan/LPS O-acetylase OafA/YrhL
MLLVHLSIDKAVRNMNLTGISILIFSFLTINVFGSFLPLYGSQELARGYIALLLAIALSTNVKEHSVISNLSVCSFGIYLSHLIVLEGFSIIGHRVHPEFSSNLSTPMLLTTSLASLGISWLTTAFLSKRKFLSKLIFGS